LRELIKEAVLAERQGLLAINRDDGRPLLLTAIPLKPTGGVDFVSDPARGVVFISDPERSDSPSVESLRRGFNLTYREASL
jgi:hypothetical protein